MSDKSSAQTSNPLVQSMRDLYRAYVRLLESGKERIEFHGGTCDSVDQMERGDPYLIAANIAIQAAEIEQRHAPETTVRPPHWTCRTHGDFDAMREVGCPECMRLARQALIQIQRETWGSGWEVSQEVQKIACAALDPPPPEKASEPRGPVLTRVCPGCNTVHSGPLCPTENGGASHDGT